METILLGERCTLENIRDSRDLILTAMEHAQEQLVIDLSNLTEIDTAGIQLLVSGLKESEKRSVSLIFKGPVIPEIAEAINISGVHYGELK